MKDKIKDTSYSFFHLVVDYHSKKRDVFIFDKYHFSPKSLLIVKNKDRLKESEWIMIIKNINIIIPFKVKYTYIIIRWLFSAA